MGRYHATAEVPAFDSLGVAVPEYTLDLRAGEPAHLDVYVPAGRTLFAALCAESAPRTGAVLGVVRTAENQHPLADAVVRLTWDLGGRGRIADVRADADGRYRACGVPGGVAVRVQARTADSAGASAARSGLVELRVPEGGLTFRELWVTRPAAGQMARLAGVVLDTRGYPVAGAYVRLVDEAEELGAADTTTRRRTAVGSRSDGQFYLTGLPAGSQTFELLRIGFAPQRFSAELQPNRTSGVSLRMLRTAAALDTIRVTATHPRAYAAHELSWDQTGFLRRRATRTGAFFSRQQIADRGEPSLDQMFEANARFVVNGDGTVAVRQNLGVPSFGTGAGTGVVGGPPPNGGPGQAGGACEAAVYLDDVPFSGTLREIPAASVHGIETYWGANIPIRYAGARAACGVILVWTGWY